MHDYLGKSGRSQTTTHVLFGISLALAALLFGTTVRAQDHRRAAVAFVEGERVLITDASGTVLRAVPLQLRQPVLQIAVDADGTELIVTLKSFGRGEMGGDFFLWTTADKTWRQITHGPYVYKRVEKGHREVYDGPAFSPSGTRIAFAIHTESLYDDNDVVDAAGPLALMDLKTRRITVIKSTLEDPQKGPDGPPWYANSAQWSANGNRLLVNFDSGFGMVDLATGRLTALDLQVDGDATSYAVNWLSPDEVLFVSYPEDQAKPTVPHSLTLSDGVVSSAPERFKHLNGNLLAFNTAVSVVEVSGEREVRGSSVWKLPKPGIFGLCPLVDEPR